MMYDFHSDRHSHQSVRGDSPRQKYDCLLIERSHSPFKGRTIPSPLPAPPPPTLSARSSQSTKSPPAPIEPLDIYVQRQKIQIPSAGYARGSIKGEIVSCPYGNLSFPLTAVLMLFGGLLEPSNGHNAPVFGVSSMVQIYWLRR